MSDDELTTNDFRAVNGLARVPDTSNLPPPQMPVVYAEACRAITACTTINEAKYWSDKADALAAWARIYHEDKVSIEAKRLKLHAYRRMADLADQIMPDWRAERGFRVASVPIILRDHGIPHGQAQVIAKIGKLPLSKLKQAIASRKPPTPSTLAWVDSSAQPMWTRIKRTLSSFKSLTDEVDVTKLAKEMDDAERTRAYDLAHVAIAWCFELTQVIEDIESDLQKKAG